MRIAVGSDEKTHLTDFVVAEIQRRDHEVELVGPLKGEPLSWVDVGEQVASAVATGRCQQGVVFCWTGTGVSIAANKVPGIRAALCSDAQTAEGAKKWDHANVLAMSLRLTSEPVALEILDAWFKTECAPGEDAAIVGRLPRIEEKYRKSR